jgi:sugar phosphate isomerase/epimerase
MYPNLKKSYKGFYPFRISTTSYIYPDHIHSNVKMLAPYLEEIELLLFESSPDDSLPTAHAIRELSELAKTSGLTYNIHLPIDISVSDRDPSVRRHGVEIIKRIIELTAPLTPTTYTLHIPWEEPGGQKENLTKWRERSYRSIEQILAGGIPGRTLSVETLMYPFEWLDDILVDLNLSVCLDLGHLILQGFDIEAHFKKYHERTSIIHLHGVRDNRDHLSIDMLPARDLTAVMEILKQFTGTVSLEVFAFKHLNTSLTFLEQNWREDRVIPFSSPP